MRKKYIDVLRAIAIIFVVISHVDGMSMGIGSYDTPTALFIYLFNIPLFFFLSGLFAHKSSTGSFKVDVFRKVRQLLIPTIFIGILSYFLIDYRLDKGYGYYWFTICLFVYFFLYFLIVKIFKNKIFQYICLILVAFIGILSLAVINDYTKFIYLDINHWAKYFQFFVLGVIVSRENLFDRIFSNRFFQLLVPILFFILFSLVYRGTLSGLYLSIIRDIVLRYLGVFMVVSCVYQWKDSFEKSNIFNNSLQYIGTHTLEIYLLHFFFLPNLIFLQHFMLEDGRMILDLCFSTILSLVIICLSLASCALVEKNIFFRKYILGKKS